MTSSIAAPRETWDPLAYRTPGVMRKTWFPLGCPVEITTGSDEILQIAETVWAGYDCDLPGEPIHLTVSVSNVDAEINTGSVVSRGQEHLISFVHNAANFGVADLNTGFAHIVLSRNASRNRSYLLDTFLEPLTYLMLGARHFVLVHASCVARNGRAVLLCGDSGAGKTCLAYMCARMGWSFLSGDTIQVIRQSVRHEIIGRPDSVRFRDTAKRLFPELAGRPVSMRGLKADLECGMRSLGIETTQKGNASHVVFLNRVEEAKSAALEPFSRVEAQAWMEEVLIYGNPALRGEQRNAISTLLNLPVFRLTYSDLGAAEEALRDLVDAQ